MKKEIALSFFHLSGIEVLNSWELTNQYFPVVPDYAQVRADNPWWLVKTHFGLIQIGWRKRVISIDWSDTEIRSIVTEDDVTKSESMVHAWSEMKAVEYLQNLSRASKQIPSETCRPV